MTDQKPTDLEAAARRARDLLRQVSLLRRKIGPIATQAQTIAWELSAALGEGDPAESEVLTDER